MQPYIEKYKNQSGLMDAAEFLNSRENANIKQEIFFHHAKKLTKFILPCGTKFYLKPTSYRGASAEKIVSEMYQNLGMKAPNTTIAAFDDGYCAITNDIFDDKNIVSGEEFLCKITPAGAQYALPRIFGEDIPDSRVISYFDDAALKRVAEHYGLALATQNWDANLGGLGFLLDKNQKRASDIITFDFAGSLQKGHLIEYANPFCARRISYFEMINYYRKLQQKFIGRKDIIEKVRTGLNRIDEIVTTCKDSGFVPDCDYVARLKTSMCDMVDFLKN